MEKPVESFEWVGIVQTVILAEQLVPRTAAEVHAKALRQSTATLKWDSIDQQAFDFVQFFGRYAGKKHDKPDFISISGQ